MFKKLNVPLIILPVLIYVFGFITLLSTAPSLVKNHLLFFVIGLIFYLVFSLIDYSIYKYIWKYLYLLGALLLFITLLFEFRAGASRWLVLGPFSFQTSELAKLILIISLASFVTEQRNNLNTIKNIFIMLGTTLIYFVLILIQPDLGTAFVMVLIAGGLVFYGGISKVYILVGLLLVGVFSMPLWSLLKDYQKERILVFLNPQLDVLGSGYNVIQSIIAVGSGGLFGKGFGQGTQATLQFLPAYWTDFIFASFAEEWGFLGVFLIVSINTLLLILLIRLAGKTSDPFGKLLLIGIFLVYFSQFTINIGMNLGIMPVTGVTLPLVSYGGSSMVISLMMLGIAQNVWVKNT